MAGVLHDRAPQISEAASQAELDFFRDILPVRRVTMGFAGRTHEFFTRPIRRPDTPPEWHIFAQAGGEWHQLSSASLAARIDFIRNWADFREEYLAEIAALEAYALERWPNT